MNFFFFILLAVMLLLFGYAQWQKDRVKIPGSMVSPYEDEEIGMG